MSKQHTFLAQLRWTGNLGTGTSGYQAYSRNHIISGDTKPDIPCSSDPVFRGDGSRYNPEELLVASLSSCHQLWFLHLAAVAGVVVTEYTDNACGIMEVTADGGGHFLSVTLRPAVKVTDASMIEKIPAIHHRSHELCFIANSVNFPVIVEATSST